MPSSDVPSAREVLIESLGGVSDAEKEKLRGPGRVHFATQKIRALRQSQKWVIALGITMCLLALVLPTSAFYHYYQAADSFEVLEFLGLIAGACTFAAAQTGWAVYMYMNWRRKLQCYRGLRALGREAEAEPGGPAAT